MKITPGKSQSQRQTVDLLKMKNDVKLFSRLTSWTQQTGGQGRGHAGDLERSLKERPPGSGRWGSTG